MKRLLFCLLLVGCGTAMRQENEAKYQSKSLQAKLAMHMGETEDDIIEVFGAPSYVSKAGSYTIYHYRESYGTRGTGVMFNGGVSRTNSYESYEDIQMFFKEGKLVDWRQESVR